MWFQFQTGAIRSGIIVFPLGLYSKCFNSKLVRLEGYKFDIVWEGVCMFQFQTGAIRSCKVLSSGRSAMDMFQFQTGAIRSDL